MIAGTKLFLTYACRKSFTAWISPGKKQILSWKIKVFSSKSPGKAWNSLLKICWPPCNSKSIIKFIRFCISSLTFASVYEIITINFFYLSYFFESFTYKFIKYFFLFWDQWSIFIIINTFFNCFNFDLELL